jgi:hypothetical protein
MIAQDTRFAVRLLAKDRSFTITALLTLALCIGVMTGVFSVVSSVLLRPLPFDGADRLVRIYNSYPRANVERGGASAPDYFDRREQVPALQEVAMLQSRGVTVGEAGRPERVMALAASPSFFRMLGVRPIVGRTFSDGEAEPGNDRVALLGWGTWQEQFGGAADVAGRTIRCGSIRSAGRRAGPSAVTCSWQTTPPCW